jgi:hypothetical protein
MQRKYLLSILSSAGLFAKKQMVDYSLNVHYDFDNRPPNRPSNITPLVIKSSKVQNKSIFQNFSYTVLIITSHVNFFSSSKNQPKETREGCNTKATNSLL